MSRELADLKPACRAKAEAIQAEFEKRTGHKLQIYCTLRTIAEQCELYAHGRTFEQLAARFKDVPFVARAVYREYMEGKHGDLSGLRIVTNALPLSTWHHYGEAFDAVPTINGVAQWDDEKLWAIHGQCVKAEGMTWGGDFSSPDKPHAQMRPEGNPLRVLKPAEIAEAK